MHAVEALETVQFSMMGGAEVILLAHRRFSSKPITCLQCEGFGTMFWDLGYPKYEAAPFVGISGDFRTQHSTLDAAEYWRVCTNREATRWPVALDTKL